MMHGLWNHTLLLAQRSRLDNLSGSFKGRSNGIDKGDMMTGLLILAGVAALVWLLSRFLAYQDRRQAYNSPLRLFLALCKAQGLRWPDRWLLWRLARSRRLKDPGRLFLEPQWFETAGMPRSLFIQGARLARLRARLFAEPPPAAKRNDRQAELEPRPAAVAAGKSPGKKGGQTVTPLLPTPPKAALDIPPWPACAARLVADGRVFRVMSEGRTDAPGGPSFAVVEALFLGSGAFLGGGSADVPRRRPDRSVLLCGQLAVIAHLQLQLGQGKGADWSRAASAFMRP